LREVSLAVRPGEVATVVGPNGAGKTTALKIALGLEAPDRGVVRRMKNLRPAYLPQRSHFRRAIPLTVGGFLNLRRRRSKGEIEAALREAGLACPPGASVHSLSGGEVQRMLLARVFLCRPRLMVLDEPTQGLDIAGESEFYAAIDRHRAAHPECAVLAVSHDLERVMLSSDHIYCINGEICCEGDAASVRADPRFSRQFGMPPSVGVYAHRHAGHSLSSQK
jgi:zinc transport system ATP-binding protein